jgi:hypothetical protein
MKKFKYLIIIFSIFYNISYSNPVDTVLAKTIAKNYFEFLNPLRTNIEIKNTITIYYNGYPSYYIINFIGSGNITVSANDATVPILSYSYNKTYDENGFHNPAYLEWMENYSKEIDSVRANNVNNSLIIGIWNNIINKNFTKSEDSVVVPLIKTKWGQTKTNDGQCPGYNSLCQYNSGCNCEHCSAGCVAIAMAQVMKYWMHPVHSTYQDYDWCNMPNRLLKFDNSGTLNPDFDIQQKAIATLVHDCGAKVNMNYCGWDCSSAAWVCDSENGIDARYALVNNFGYSNDAFCAKKNNNEFWESRLKDNLNWGYPIIYSGGGHAFICNGYAINDQDNGLYFYFNWGWYGNHDGEHFKIGDLTPGSFNFTSNQKAIFNLHPNWYINCNSEVVLDNCEIVLLSGHYFFSSASEGFVSRGFSYETNGNLRIKFDDIGAGTITSYNTTIPSDVDINFKAYNQIILDDGFVAEEGSNFVAEIIPCPAECNNSDLKNEMFSDNYEWDNTNFNNQNSEKNTNSEKDIKKINYEFEFQVYPNPFEKRTNIIYTVKGNEKFDISIYNIYGIKLYSLINGIQPAGKYNLLYDTSNLPNGVYICIFSSKNRREIIKLLKY